MRSICADTGIQHRVEQRSQAASHPCVRVAHAIDLARRDELPQPLVELLGDEAVERDAAIEQPVEGLDRRCPPPRSPAAPRCCSDTRSRLSTVPSPNQPPGGTPVKVIGMPQHRVVAHLEQAVEHAEPVRRRTADAAQHLARCDLDHLQFGSDAHALVRLRVSEPRRCWPVHPASRGALVRAAPVAGSAGIAPAAGRGISAHARRRRSGKTCAGRPSDCRRNDNLASN